MNKVILIGRLTRDPELRYSQQGIAVTNFTVAVDRRYGGEDKQADFIDVVAWRKLAEIVGEHCRKGQLVVVEGRIEVSSYEKDGEKRRRWQVVAENVRFLSRPSGE